MVAEQIRQLAEQTKKATEEVVASADQVLEISMQNKTYAEEVKNAIDTIRSKTEGLKAYL